MRILRIEFSIFSSVLIVLSFSYGWLNHFRPEPLMPNQVRGGNRITSPFLIYLSQVYRLDPDTGAVRVIATDFDKCNGIAFTGDGKTAYMFAPIFFLTLHLLLTCSRVELTLAHRAASSEIIRQNPPQCERPIDINVRRLLIMHSDTLSM